MELYIDNRHDKYQITKEIEVLAEKTILETLNIENVGNNYEVSLSFVTDEEIRELNRDYRGIDKSTDVLSFPMDDEFNTLETPLLGDIIISLDTAYKQAEEYGHSIEREIAYLVCHSTLHLLGYDHIEEDDKLEMRDKEKSVMKKLRIFKGE